MDLFICENVGSSWHLEGQYWCCQRSTVLCEPGKQLWVYKTDNNEINISECKVNAYRRHYRKNLIYMDACGWAYDEEDH